MSLDFGWPQAAALAVLLQRGLEELYSARNTRNLLARGGHEEGRDYYPVVAVTHLAWIASIFFLISPYAPIVWPLLVLYLLLQVVRYWVIGKLGRYWTHRIITLAKRRLCAGPYVGFGIRTTWSRSPKHCCCRWCSAPRARRDHGCGVERGASTTRSCSRMLRLRNGAICEPHAAPS